MEGSILYELVGCAQWAEEKDLTESGVGPPTVGPDKSIISRLGGGRVLKRHPSVFDTAEWLSCVGPSWKFLPTLDGKLVAVLQPSVLETRCDRDNFSSPLGKTTVLKDHYPHFRCMAWNDSGTLLAVSFTNGQISFFDTVATQLFVVRLHQNPEVGSSMTHFTTDFALSGLFFVEHRVKKNTFPNELVAADRRGSLRGYRQTNADTMTFHHEGSLRRYYPHGVTNVAFCRTNALVLASGVLVIGNQKMKAKEHNLKHGITAWRLLDESPYYRVVFSVTEQELRMDSRGLWNIAYGAITMSSKYQDDVIFRSSVSPDGKLLAGIHTSGAISIWHLPSLKLSQYWPLRSQFQFNAENPRFNCNWRIAFNRISGQQIDPWRFYPFHVNWWNSNVVIISRCNGCVTLCSASDHVPSQNLLGESPELFESPVQVSSRIGKGFFAFETDLKNEDGKDLSMTEMDVVDDEYWVKSMVQEVMFWLTDMERFRPARKRKRRMPTLLQLHRLLNVKSITPQELFHRKIDAEEYGEALDIARIYSLDGDLVYQRRWTKSPVTSESIKNFLGKISKRNWVLQECLDRVPEQLDAARELLEFGLKGTEVMAAVTISQGRDKGRFIILAPESLNVSEKECLTILDKSNIEVQRLIDYRRRLLYYMDILRTYEFMLGGYSQAAEKYDKDAYAQLRSRAPLESCVLMARGCDTDGLKVFLTYQWNDVCQNYLDVLNNFPETESPRSYREFLPEVHTSGKVLTWRTVVPRKKDWSDTFLGTDGSSLLNVSASKYSLSVEDVVAWYKYRVCEIETITGLTNYSLQLAKLGVELNIPEMKELVRSLEIVETLVYDIKLEDMTIKQYERLSNLEKLELLMSKSNEETFVHNFRFYALPFLEQCEEHNPGSRYEMTNEYFTSKAKKDLALVVQVFENSTKENTEPLIADTAELLKLAHSCIYACESNEQDENVQKILACLPPPSYGAKSAEIMTLRDTVGELEMQFSASRTISKYGLSYTLAELNALAHDRDDLKRFFQKVCHHASKKTPALKIPEWKSLLTDMLELQRKVFPDFEAKECYMIYVETLLRSGSSDVINLAKNFLDQTPTEVDTDEKGNLKINRQNSTAYSTSYAIYVYLIPYEESLGMVLEGAEFYFDSACTYADPDMELAKTCLNLMHNTKEPSISFMFDLIDAMKLFNKDFSLNILPQSVRKSNDKLALLRKAMENIPNGYRKIQQLLRLAVYLHIEDMDTMEVESYVYEMAGNAGLEEEERDIKFCMQICHNIVAKNYETGWKIFTEVAKDGSDPPIVDHETRLAFINYALNICPSEEILNVLNAKYLIEIRRLHSQLADISPENIEPEVSDEEDTVQSERTETPDPNESYKTTLEDLIDKTSSYSAWINPLKKISQVVETSRKVLLTGKDTVSNIVEQAQAGLGVRQNDILSPEVEISNEDFALESYPLIYTDEEDERRIHLSRLASRYNTFAENAVSAYVKSQPALELALTLNQIWHLEQLLLGRTDAGHRDMKVLEQLVTTILPEDIPWGFGILLSIDDSASFEEVIEKVPQSDACIGVILVILMFRINRKLSPEIRPEDYATSNLRTMFQALDERLSENYEEDEKLEGFIQLYHKYKEYISPLDSSSEVPETDNSSSVYEDFAEGDGWES